MVIILMAQEKLGIKLYSDRTCKQRERSGLRFHYFLGNGAQKVTGAGVQEGIGELLKAQRIFTP